MAWFCNRDCSRCTGDRFICVRGAVRRVIPALLVLLVLFLFTCSACAKRVSVPLADSLGVTVRQSAMLTNLASFLSGVRRVTAITIGGTVFVRPGVEKDHKTFLHELTHVEQQRRMGLSFYPRYWWESLKHGYSLNKYEIEAEVEARRRLSR